MAHFNRILSILFVLSLVYTFYFYLSVQRERGQKKLSPPSKKASVENRIYLSTQALNDFGEGLLGLKSERYQREIESHLQYLGVSARPDQKSPRHYFRWRGKDYSLSEGSSLSFHDLDLGSLEYLKEFKLAFQCADSETHLEVFNNQKTFLSFKLLASYKLEPISINGVRFDKSFLARQKICWVGPDLFLKYYGKQEYPKGAKGQRIDFGTSKDSYFCFVEEGDLLMYDQEKWVPYDQTGKKLPLMQIKKMDEKFLFLTVWAEDGRHSHEYKIPKSYVRSSSKKKAPLKFVGAKTKSKWLVQGKKERFSLEKGDWLIHKEASWTKIKSLQDLEAYVQRVNLGELFVVKELEQEEGHKVLSGDFFNASRTEVEAFKLYLDMDKKTK